jgi:hypothetical protein
METDIKEDFNNVDFLARFACLYEGVNLACTKAEQLGIDPNKSTAWIKPLAFQKYIKEREKDMKYQVEQWFKEKNTQEITDGS